MMLRHLLTLDFKRNLKIGLSCVGKMYLVSAFPTDFYWLLLLYVGCNES